MTYKTQVIRDVGSGEADVAYAPQILGPHVTIRPLQIFRPCSSIIGQFLQSLDGLSTLISPDRIKNCMDRDAKCLNERSNNLMMPHLALLKLERRKALCLEKVFLHYNVIVLYVVCKFLINDLFVYSGHFVFQKGRGDIVFFF